MKRAPFETHKARLHAFLTARPDASFREMRRALRCNINTIFHALDDLADDGAIRRLPQRVRAIEVLRPAPIHINGEPYRFIPMGRA